MYRGVSLSFINAPIRLELSTSKTVILLSYSMFFTLMVILYLFVLCLSMKWIIYLGEKDRLSPSVISYPLENRIRCYSGILVFLVTIFMRVLYEIDGVSDKIYAFLRGFLKYTLNSFGISFDIIINMLYKS